VLVLVLAIGTRAGLAGPILQFVSSTSTGIDDTRPEQMAMAPDGGHVVTSDEVAACTLEPDGHTLLWHLGQDQPGPDDVDFVVATVLPRALTRQRAHVLHAATVVGPKGAVLLCGLSGIGKSTTAAALHRATGWPLLGDDAA